jgi:UDP-glucose 4-epimerase
VAIDLQDARVLITGGAGFIGSLIADLLIQEGVREIVIFDNFSRGKLSNLAWVRGHGTVSIKSADIRDAKAVLDAMRGMDVVFHEAATRITHCTEDPRLGLEVLVDGTFNVLDAARIAGVRKIIAASSASVYGMAEQFPTPEEHHSYASRTLYGAAKAFNEGLLRSFHEMYCLDYVALRYSNVYGPRMDTQGRYTEVFVRWMERIASGLSPLIFGDGGQTMDFVFVADVARANILAAQSDATDVVLNIASGTETSLNDLARSLAAVMGSDLMPQYVTKHSVNAVSRRLLDTRKAHRVLGFSAEIGLINGLERLVEWWRQSKAADIKGGCDACNTAEKGRR